MCTIQMEMEMHRIIQMGMHIMAQTGQTMSCSQHIESSKIADCDNNDSWQKTKKQTKKERKEKFALNLI